MVGIGGGPAKRPAGRKRRMRRSASLTLWRGVARRVLQGTFQGARIGHADRHGRARRPRVQLVLSLVRPQAMCTTVATGLSPDEALVAFGADPDAQPVALAELAERL